MNIELFVPVLEIYECQTGNFNA